MKIIIEGIKQIDQSNSFLKTATVILVYRSFWSTVILDNGYFTKIITFPPFKYKKQCHYIKIVDSFKIFVIQKDLFRDPGARSDDVCPRNQIDAIKNWDP